MNTLRSGRLKVKMGYRVFLIIIIQEFEFGGLIFKSRPGFPTAKVKVCGSISASTPFSHVKQNASSFLSHTWWLRLRKRMLTMDAVREGLRSHVVCLRWLCAVLLLLFWDSIWCRSGLPSFSLKRNLALNSWFFCLHLPKAWITGMCQDTQLMLYSYSQDNGYLNHGCKRKRKRRQKKLWTFLLDHE